MRSSLLLTLVAILLDHGAYLQLHYAAQVLIDVTHHLHRVHFSHSSQALAVAIVITLISQCCDIYFYAVLTDLRPGQLALVVHCHLATFQKAGQAPSAAV